MVRPEGLNQPDLAQILAGWQVALVPHCAKLVGVTSRQWGQWPLWTPRVAPMPFTPDGFRPGTVRSAVAVDALRKAFARGKGEDPLGLGGPSCLSNPVAISGKPSPTRVQ